MENQNPNPPSAHTTQEASPGTPLPSNPVNIGPKTAYPLPRFLPKSLAIIALILIAVVFAAGIYKLGQSSQKPASVASIPTPTPADETAGWKTYVGSGFSLKYPQDWKVIENSTDSARFYPSTSDPNIPSDMISFVNNQSKPFSSVKPIPNTSDPVSIMVDGVTGWENEDNGKLPPFSHYVALPLNKGFIFFQSPKGLTSVLNQILSTFKFTN